MVYRKPNPNARLHKNMTAGDVHVPAAGGKPKRKPPVVPVVEPEPKVVVTKGNDAELDFSFAFDISKVDAEQRLIFGWASVSQIGDEEVIDKQGDIVPVDEIEKAAYDFVLYSREQGDMHADMNVGRMVESCVFTPQKAALGLVAKNDKGQQMFGWFVGFKVSSEPVWKAIKNGGRLEFSIGGKATAVEED